MLLGNRLGSWSGKKDKNYFKIESYDGGSFYYIVNNGGNLDLQYCQIVNGKPTENWMDLPYGSGSIRTEPIAIRAKNTIRSAIGARYGSTTSFSVKSASNVKISGELNYLSDPNGKFPQTTFYEDMYGNLFGNGIVDASELIIDDKIECSQYCFRCMFNVCSSLRFPPRLNAMKMAPYCYSEMFKGCTSLTTAPELPATTLADNCYYSMFQGCTSLTTIPELPATTLANYCYYYMFKGCTSLTTAVLPDVTLADHCYSNMFQGCTSLTTAVLPSTTLASNCYTNMFRGCTSLTTAPELPATTLAINCYSAMFQGCTSLTTAPELPATTLAINCYSSMFQDCTSLTTAPELPAVLGKPSNYYRYIFMNTSVNSVTVKFRDFESSPITSWLNGVPAQGTFHCPVQLGTNETILRGSGYCPSNWTVVNDVV